MHSPKSLKDPKVFVLGIIVGVEISLRGRMTERLGGGTITGGVDIRFGGGATFGVEDDFRFSGGAVTGSVVGKGGCGGAMEAFGGYLLSSPNGLLGETGFWADQEGSLRSIVIFSGIACLATLGTSNFARPESSKSSTEKLKSCVEIGIEVCAVGRVFC